jgi:hypothetical protein
VCRAGVVPVLARSPGEVASMQQPLSLPLKRVPAEACWSSKLCRKLFGFVLDSTQRKRHHRPAPSRECRSEQQRRRTTSSTTDCNMCAGERAWRRRAAQRAELCLFHMPLSRLHCGSPVAGPGPSSFRRGQPALCIIGDAHTDSLVVSIGVSGGHAVHF